MSRKTMAQIAIAMIVIFGLTVLLYPKAFSPDQDEVLDNPVAPVEGPPQPGAPEPAPVATPPPVAP